MHAFPRTTHLLQSRSFCWFVMNRNFRVSSFEIWIDHSVDFIFVVSPWAAVPSNFLEFCFLTHPFSQDDKPVTIASFLGSPSVQSRHNAFLLSNRPWQVRIKIILQRDNWFSFSSYDHFDPRRKKCTVTRVLSVLPTFFSFMCITPAVCDPNYWYTHHPLLGRGIITGSNDDITENFSGMKKVITPVPKVKDSHPYILIYTLFF